MALPIPSINGLYYDHTSVRLQIPGLDAQTITQHLKSINFSDQLNPSTSYGVSPIQLPSGLGQYDAEASCVISKEAFDNMIASLPGGYGAAVLGFSIVYVPRNSFSPSRVDLIDSRIKSVKDSSSNGQGNLDVELGFYVRYILRNGKCLAPLDVDVVSTRIAG